MQLEVKPYEQIKPIEFNYEELKTQLLTKLDTYKHLQYTSDQIQAAKTDRAALNSLKKALNDERIRREKEFLEPFNQFKAQIKELCDLIDEPVKLIDAQVKEYEEMEKREKREACQKIFYGTEGLPDWLKYEQVENVKWYNKTTSIRTVAEEIKAKINHINVDIQMLSALPDFSFEAIEVYKETLDSGKALVEGNRLADIQKRKEEEQKRKEETERLAKEVEERTKTPDIPFMDGEVREIIPDEPKAEETRVWLSFRAYLSKSDALELKAFLNAMGIQYEAIKEDKTNGN